MTEFPVAARDSTDIVPFTVDSKGDTYGESTRDRELIIRSERLDAQHPVVRIDLRKIVTQYSGFETGISIIVQDFGLPARMININADFVTSADHQSPSTTDTNHSTAPEHLSVTALSRDRDKTYSLDDRDLPIDWEPVGLSEGQAMLFVHEGLPSDERTGYINSDPWELIALTADKYYGTPDFSDIASQIPRHYVPFIGLGYRDSVLSLHSLDGVHAEVQYQQLRSLADDVPAIAEATATDFDEADLIASLLAGDTDAKATLESLLAERREALTTNTLLRAELEGARNAYDSLETMFAGMKRKLGDARSTVVRLEGEVRRLRQQAPAAPPAGEQTDADFLRDILSSQQATQEDPHGHIASLGLTPAFLVRLNPAIAEKVVKGVYRGLAQQFHSDKQQDSAERDDEPMKHLNIAVDSILRRLSDGYWGRK